MDENNQITSIKAEECAEIILNSDEGRSQMSEISKLNPAIKYFEERKDIVELIERELEYRFLYIRGYLDEVKKINSNFYFDEIDIEIERKDKNNVSFRVPIILKYSIKYLIENVKLSSDFFDELSQVLVYKNFESLPFFRFKKDFEDLVDAHRNDENLTIENLFNELKEKVKDYGLSSEFMKLVFIDNPKLHLGFERDRDKKIYAKPFLKLLFKRVVENREIFKELHKNILRDMYETETSNPDYKTEFLSKILNIEDLAYATTVLNKGFTFPFNSTLDMTVYIDGEMKNDMNYLKKLDIDSEINQTDETYKKFDSYTSKLAYCYLKCDYETLQKAFKFRDFNKVIPFKKYHSTFNKKDVELDKYPISVIEVL